MTKIEKTDLRIVKTQRAIRNAFIDLLELKEFKDIQAQEIIEKALINRSTFYKYYRGKNDLAKKLINEVCTEYAAIVKERFESKNVQLLMQKLTLTIIEKAPLILALWKIRTQKHNLHYEMENILKQAFVHYAQSNVDAEKDWEYHSIIFAFLSLTSLKYYLERNEILPLGQLTEKWKEVIDVIELAKA